MNELQLDKINIEDYIFEVRGRQVMLANDLAKFLNVETKRINEVVKRNKEKFSNNVCFQLYKNEYDEIFLRSQLATLDENKKESRTRLKYLPYVFTSEGIRLISTILRSKNVVQITDRIINAFERKDKSQLLSQNLINSSENIRNMIYEIRGKQVILDSDVARLFDYSTKDLNRNVKNNIERFPESYCFQLTEEECANLRCKIFTSSYGGRRYLPYVFTEYGITMLAGLLKSDVAIQASINIVNTFIEMRKLLGKRNFETRLSNVEQKIIDIDVKNELKFQKCNNKFDILFSKFKEPENTYLFYDGKIYDAFSLLLDILNEAKNNIIIIDNYIDKSLLDVIAKLKVNVKIITSYIDKDLIIKYKKQYSNIKIIINNCYHDRFIIIDRKILYHSGASFKDLGKKCFAINKINNDDILKQLLNKIEI